MSYAVAAFYKFVPLDDCSSVQSWLREVCESNGIIGTILVAPEGINGTIAGSAEGMKATLAAFRADSRFGELEVKHSLASSEPFGRLKIKIKPEIVTFGVDGLRPDLVTGQLVEPQDWNALIAREDVLVIDTRNSYEFELGTFEGAVDPRTQNFRQFVPYIQEQLASDPARPIAMFCTGGIRCEKATSYMLSLGFENVYQLRGGILNYLETIPEDESLWRGQCFVFDERIALEHGVQEGRAFRCRVCGQPCSSEVDAGKSECPSCLARVG